jgi:hypothetical protein
MTAIHGEQESLLHLREGDGGRRERGNGRGGTGASAQGIQGVAALQDKQGEQQHAERSQSRVNSFHTASYTRGRGGLGNGSNSTSHARVERGDHILTAGR